MTINKKIYIVLKVRQKLTNENVILDTRHNQGGGWFGLQ